MAPPPAMPAAYAAAAGHVGNKFVPVISYPGMGMAMWQFMPPAAVEENLKSDLSLWQLGTLPPGLIAFHGHVHVIEPFWHMLGLGYQENTSAVDVERAAVIHFNGRAKPWLDIAFPELKKLWTKYVNYSDKFIKSCHITAA
ncbi:putative polygalacturonate 4-alpha-galacturonosyltransferase [Helianthus annuus]|nr:putative polygalacturonate 4-alpha-galacturonosyltransferase [Helianthus annuus]